MLRKEIRDFLIVISIFIILCLFFFKDVLFSGSRLLSSPQCDLYNFGFPFHYLIFKQLNVGKIVYWNQFLSLGVPLINYPGNALFYPLNIIFFVFPLNLAFNYSFIINILLSGIMSYLYLRYLERDCFSSLVGAIVFMLSGPALLHIYAGHLHNALPWIPLLFLLLEMYIRENKLITVILGGLVLGIQLLTPNPQYSFYTIIGLTLYLLFSLDIISYKRRKLSILALHFSGYFIMLLIGLCIAAVKLIPSAEFVRLADRNAHTYEFVASWSFPLENLITCFLPEFFGDMIHCPYWSKYALWEMCAYVGILPLILSILAVVYKRNKYTLFFAFLSLFALLGALGVNLSFLSKLFYYFLPGYNLFRGHSKFIILFVFSIAVLSAYGSSWLLEKRERAPKDLKKTALLLGILGSALILITLFAHLKYSLSLQWWSHIWKGKGWFWELSEATFACAVFSLIKFTSLIVIIFLVFFFWMKKSMSLQFVKISVIVLIVADLWLFGAKYLVLDDVKECYWDRKIVNFLMDKGPLYTYRVMSPHHYGPFPNKALLDGIQMVDGYDGIYLERYLNLFALSSLEPIDSPRNLKLLSMANLKFLLMPKGIKLKNPALSNVYETNNVIVWHNSKCLPRAYIVHGVKIIKDNKERVLNILFNERFDPLSTVILEEAGSINTGVESLPQQYDESVKFLKYANDEVIIQAVLKKDGYLILSDLNYPGWRADILNLKTGERKQMEPLYANNLFRAVDLSAGKYTIRFAFKPKSFYRGLLITILTLIITILSLILLRLKQSKHSRSK